MRLILITCYKRRRKDVFGLLTLASSAVVQTRVTEISLQGLDWQTGAFKTMSLKSEPRAGLKAKQREEHHLVLRNLRTLTSPTPATRWDQASLA
jgi:hypothetical protein